MGPEMKRGDNVEKKGGKRRLGKRDGETAGNTERCLMVSTGSVRCIPHGGRVSPSLKIHNARGVPRGISYAEKNLQVRVR